jgi:hypothetical protein
MAAAGNQIMKLSLWAPTQMLPNRSPNNQSSSPVTNRAAVDSTTKGASKRIGHRGGPARR